MIGPENTSGWSRSELYVIKALEQHGADIKEVGRKLDAMGVANDKRFEVVHGRIASVRVEMTKRMGLIGLATAVILGAIEMWK